MHQIFKYSRGWTRLRSPERMSGIISGMAENNPKKTRLRALLMLACAALALPMAAQQQGPLPPPPPGTIAPVSAPPAAPRRDSGTQERSSHITSEPPAIPVERIIKKFTENEAEFRKERENYTYTQVVVFQTIDDDGQPDGEYRMISDMTFNSKGKRDERIVQAPVSTIQR